MTILSPCTFCDSILRVPPTTNKCTLYKEPGACRLSCDVCQLNIEGFVLSVLFLVSSPLRNIKVSQCKSLKIPINFPSFLLTPVQPLNLTF